MTDRVRDYHERTKHRFEHYAKGPEFLDWEAQPNPFRHFAGCADIDLPLDREMPATTFAVLDRPEHIAAVPLSLEGMAMLLRLAFGLSAWKEFQGDRWALRCNPSSGNLHPTEVYALPLGVDGIDDGVYHYCSDMHRLEQRCRVPSDTGASSASGILIGLSSVQWREAWKYGERAFRYCQLDCGHAMAALRYAAAILGWQVTLLSDWSDDDIASLLGLDQDEAFVNVENEEPEALLWVTAANEAVPAHDTLLARSTNGKWVGKANLLDPKPMYDWPVIADAATASRNPATESIEPFQHENIARIPFTSREPAASIILQRRSAQQFDPRLTLGQDAFFRILTALMPCSDTTPWDMWKAAPRLHPVLFVHRVEGIRAGLYALPRSIQAKSMLQESMRPEFTWQHVEEAPEALPLYQLVNANCQRAAQTIACKQDIASNSAFSLAMLGEFDTALGKGAWNYRRLHHEAGIIGQALYLEAEAAGVRGTGIGCFFDDGMHQTLGISGTVLQDIYHFTVGFPLSDTRLQTLPPYAHLSRP